MNKFAKKSALSLLLILLVACLILVGCGGSGNSAKSPIEAKDGYAEGRIGDTFKNYFFNYSVDSVSFVKEYEGLTPQEGNHFIDAVITIKNTFGQEIPLWLNDFQIQWDIEDDQKNFGHALFVDSKDTLPEEYMLQNAETITKHYLFEVPADSKKYSISFLETFEDGTEGAVFFTFFENK